MGKSNQRGSALVEATPVLVLLVIFISGFLLAAYVLFAKAWIQYQSEQALYCLAEDQFQARCQMQLNDKLRQFLVWGEVATHLSRADDEWKVEIKWSYRKYSLTTHKELSPKLITRNKDLQW